MRVDSETTAAPKVVGAETHVSVDLTQSDGELVSFSYSEKILDEWSVVLCGFTTERWNHLCAAIDSALFQKVAPREVIVVVDHNEVLLERLRQRYENGRVSVIPNEGPRGPSGGRNTGILHATGDFIAFIDDDAVAEPDWLEQISKSFENPDVVGAGGLILPDWELGAAPRWMPGEFLWAYGCTYEGHPLESVTIRAPIGANMAFRREAMIAAGGFDASFSGGLYPGALQETAGGAASDVGLKCEETDLAVRITRDTGHRVVFAPEAVVHHSVTAERSLFRYFAGRCMKEGRSKAVMALRNGLTRTTSTERSFVLHTLIPGVGRRLVGTVRRRQVAPLLQALSIVTGLGLAGATFVASALINAVRPGRWRLPASVNPQVVRLRGPVDRSSRPKTGTEDR